MRLGETTSPFALELVGISHKTASLEALERLALSAGETDQLLERIGALEADGLVLSTCNRTEIYAMSRHEQELASGLDAALREVVGHERFPRERALYVKTGRDAMRHLFAVASGLDSMVLGESQILGQLKEAFELAIARRAPSPLFERLVQGCIAAAKRSRVDTEIGRGAVSTASAAAHLVTRIYSDLGKCTVVVIGAGDTARLLAEHLATHQPHRLIVVNRTLERGQELARAVGGEAWSYDRLPEAMAAADIVGAAVRTTKPVVTYADLAKAAHHRHGRPLVVLDLGLPRNVEPEAQGLANVFVNDLEALRQVMDGNLSRRKKAVPEVEVIIEEELERLFEWHRALAAGPLIASLRESFEAVRMAELERACQGLGEKERAAVDRATRAVLNKLLHGPMVSIKELARQGELDAIRDAVEALKRPRSG